MTAAITVPASIIVGDNLTVTGSGFGTTNVITIKVSNQEETLGVEFYTTASSGDFDLSDVGKVVPQVGSQFIVEVSDTSGHTVTEVVEVFSV